MSVEAPLIADTYSHIASPSILNMLTEISLNDTNAAESMDAAGERDPPKAMKYREADIGDIDDDMGMLGDSSATLKTCDNHSTEGGHSHSSLENLAKTSHDSAANGASRFSVREAVPIPLNQTLRAIASKRDQTFITSLHHIDTTPHSASHSSSAPAPKQKQQSVYGGWFSNFVAPWKARSEKERQPTPPAPMPAPNSRNEPNASRSNDMLSRSAAAYQFSSRPSSSTFPLTKSGSQADHPYALNPKRVSERTLLDADPPGALLDSFNAPIPSPRTPAQRHSLFVVPSSSSASFVSPIADLLSQASPSAPKSTTTLVHTSPSSSVASGVGAELTGSSASLQAPPTQAASSSSSPPLPRPDDKKRRSFPSFPPSKPRLFLSKDDSDTPRVIPRPAPLLAQPRPLSAVFSGASGVSKSVPSRTAPVKVPPGTPPPPPVGEDEERNKRHSEVVALLSGQRSMPEVMQGKYKIGQLLGDGAFGFVMTAKRLSDDREVAIKFIARDKIPSDLWTQDSSLHPSRVPLEISILASCRHPSVIRYVEHASDERYVLLVTELHGTEWDVRNPELNPKRNPGLRQTPRVKVVPQEGKMECSPLFRLTEEQEKSIRRRTSCDLFECIDAHVQLSDRACKKIFAQIAMAVHHLHQRGYVHRDLKDENIVIDADYNIKLVDFGSASRIPSHREHYFTKFNGTTHFASPEVVRKQSYRGPEAEVWSLGVLLFTIVFGENPFQNKAEILKGEFRFPTKIDRQCADLISKMLTYDEHRRIKVEDILKHEWIREEVERLRKEHKEHAGRK
ncbi:kinase-like protein [Gonapodya prolifera JEL478]|uniref:Kinase-like protein n=1 Tax=Gonapodya prolifera (strain JEL478) TaxID=1344416 RepID=A0A139ATU1_GONPJ|nr:kinase-like protein [Gonapodya prolifera JEL478]|eukprot:KXS20160.1 kinase-like protein [Gonapodya prolifera JEL478]